MKLRPTQGLAYGLMGMPLAFAALPLYIFLPNYYAREFGLPLAALGALLLLVRLFDALIDPLLGGLSDRLYARSLSAVWGFGALAAGLMMLGFVGLFFPPWRAPQALLPWLGVALVLTCTAYSGLTIAHQSWGTLLGNQGASDDQQRSAVVAWREGAGLLGVLLASVIPVLWGIPAAVAVLGLLLALGWLAWRVSPRPATGRHAAAASAWLPLKRSGFRRLLLVFMLNGIASAVPATLVLFFIQDRLQAPPSSTAIFLGLYFLAGVGAIPLWLLVVRRLGLSRTWLVGMVCSVLSFMGASLLQAGDWWAFGFICLASGAALGADLALPGALLARVIQDSGDADHAEGRYLGWWNFATKLNLALAAGVALPALNLLGYTPGARDAAAQHALVMAYSVLPCALKLLAGAALLRLLPKRSFP